MALSEADRRVLVAVAGLLRERANALPPSSDARRWLVYRSGDALELAGLRAPYASRR